MGGSGVILVSRLTLTEGSVKGIGRPTVASVVLQETQENPSEMAPMNSINFLIIRVYKLFFQTIKINKPIITLIITQVGMP